MADLVHPKVDSKEIDRLRSALVAQLFRGPNRRLSPLAREQSSTGPNMSNKASIRENRTMVKRRWLVACAVCSFNCLEAQTRCPESRAGDSDTVIKSGTVSMPAGAFLLIRKKGQLGAIRQTQVVKNGEEGFGTAKYESLFESSSSGAFSSKAIRQTGEISVSSPKALHAVYSYGGGNREARIGKWKFSFARPTLMPMTDESFWSGDRSDHGFEFAPTSACTVSEVLPSDQRLKRYRFDRSADLSLLLSSLPK